MLGKLEPSLTECYYELFAQVLKSSSLTVNFLCLADAYNIRSNLSASDGTDDFNWLVVVLSTMRTLSGFLYY